MEILIACELPDYELSVKHGEDYSGRYASYVLMRGDIIHFVVKYEDNDWHLLSYVDGKRQGCAVSEFPNKESLIEYIRGQYK